MLNDAEWRFQHVTSNSWVVLSFSKSFSQLPAEGQHVPPSWARQLPLQVLGAVAAVAKLLQRIVGKPSGNLTKLESPKPSVQIDAVCHYALQPGNNAPDKSHLITWHTWLRFEGLRFLEQRNLVLLRVREQSRQKVHRKISAITHGPTAALDKVIAKSNGSKELKSCKKLAPCHVQKSLLLSLYSIGLCPLTGSISCGSHSYIIFAWPYRHSIAKQLDWRIRVGAVSERQQIYCAEQLLMQQTMWFYMYQIYTCHV